MASTTHSIRQQNKQLVLKTLFQNGALFASDLVKKTGISMVTTNSLLKELLAEEEITKGPLEQKELGRPAVTYQLNQDRGHSLLLSFIDHDGSLALWSMLIDRKGKVLAKHDQPFPDVAPHRFQECVTNELALFPSVEQIALFLPGKISGGTVTSSWYEKFNGWQLAALVAEVTALHRPTDLFAANHRRHVQSRKKHAWYHAPGQWCTFRRKRCPSGRGKIFARLLGSRGTARPHGFGSAPDKLTAILQCSFCPPLYYFSQQ